MLLITFHSNSTKKYKKVEQKNNILFLHKKRVLKNMSTQTYGEENRTLFASESQLAAIFGLSSLQYLYIAASFSTKNFSQFNPSDVRSSLYVEDFYAVQ